MAGEYAHLPEGWRETFDDDYAHLDGVDRKMLLRRIVESRSKRPKIDPTVRRKVFNRDGHACLHCGSTKRLSLDHIKPYSLGGPDTFENLQTLCLSCNCKKGAKV